MVSCEPGEISGDADICQGSVEKEVGTGTHWTFEESEYIQLGHSLALGPCLWSSRARLQLRLSNVAGHLTVLQKRLWWSSV